MNNIELFNKHAAVALARLYESFPTPIDLYPQHLIDQNWVASEYASETLQSEEFESANHCLTWLYDYDFFTGAPSSYGYIFHLNSRLTPQGLAALNKVPSSLDSKEPIGKRIAAAAKSAGKEAGNNALGELIGQVIGGFTKSMTGQ